MTKQNSNLINSLFIQLFVLVILLLFSTDLSAQSFSPYAEKWESKGGHMVASGNHHFENGWTLGLNDRYWQYGEDSKKTPARHTKEEVDADVYINMGQIVIQGPGEIARAIRTKGSATAFIIEQGASARYYYGTLGSQRMNKENGEWTGKWITDTPFRQDPSKGVGGWIPAGETKTFDVICRSDWDNFGAAGQGYGSDKEVEFEFWFFPREGGKVVSFTFSSPGYHKPQPGILYYTEKECN